jgi:DNA-binding SARP family transcriptional activator
VTAERWTDAAVRVVLLEGFELRLDGEVVELPLGAQRLIAFLALHNRPLQRRFVANSLWLDSNEERAGANLRSALWRLHQGGRPVVDARGSHLRLLPDVAVDLHDAAGRARRMLSDADDEDALEPFDIVGLGDVLPDWYEDWILVERERFRQLRLHALEALCDRMTVAGRYAAAVEAGLGAVAGEPLRESAHRSLIRAYLGEGNVGEAIRQYRVCERLLHEELGIEPSPMLRDVIAEVSAGASRRLGDGTGDGDAHGLADGRVMAS